MSRPALAVILAAIILAAVGTVIAAGYDQGGTPAAEPLPTSGAIDGVCYPDERAQGICD